MPIDTIMPAARRLKRKEIILAVLLCALAASVVYRITHPFRQKTVARLTYTGRSISERQTGSDSAAESGKQDMGGSILLGLAANPPKHSGEVVRNIFELSQPEEPMPEEPMPMPEPAVNEEVFKGASDPLVSMKNEMGQYTVFGVFEGAGEKAVFLERGKDVLTVRQGDYIDGKFVVEEINREKMVMRSGDVDFRITLDLSDFQ